ncbi:Tat pathway signal sequence [Actinomyces oricola]|uniref:Tat pathway signal sequence n=1 Tax=Actinomyces oricola TaxID=206043 RepID=UPI000FFE80B8|nr:Tat pathway signal sequence [Actinomyces oricola]
MRVRAQTHGRSRPGAAGRLLPRRAVLGAVGAAALSACSAPACPAGRGCSPAGGSAGTVLLDIADDTGQLLAFDQMRRIQSNGAGSEGHDDVLLETGSLRAVVEGPLEEGREATAALELPAGGPWTLNLSWPTSHGYSALMADLPGPGRYALAELAARGLHARQGERLAAAALTAEPDLASQRQTTATALARCEAAAGPQERAQLGAQALESAAAAQLLLDSQAVALAPADALVGVTLTSPPSADQSGDLDLLKNGGRQPAARIVIEDPFDEEEMTLWERSVTELQDRGVVVVGQVCDSTAMAGLDDDAWRARVDRLLERLGPVDAWEVGNELGGDWLGQDAVERVRHAATSVRRAGGATTLLTLYHQLGQGAVEHSVVTWAQDNLDPELKEMIDVVGLSVYPQWHPLGTAADRVLGAVGELFSTQRLAVLELGYGGEDLDPGPWWFGSPDDLAAGRHAVARHVTAAALGRPRAWGAPFWWYYLEDEAPGAAGGPVHEDLTQAAEHG